MFPRLFPIGTKHKGLKQLDSRSPNSTIFTRTGFHTAIMYHIAKYLDLPSLYNLAGTNRDLRYFCLHDQSYQKRVRDTLHDTWAVPTAAEHRLPFPDGYPAPNASGDWLLYGYYVFKTESMKNRRRIFGLLDQMEKVYLQRAREKGYLDSPHADQMQEYLRAKIDQQLLLHKLDSMNNYPLLIKCMTWLNHALAEDLCEEPYRGRHLGPAVQRVRNEVQGKKTGSKRLLQRYERGIQRVIGVRMQLFMAEKRKYGAPRVFAPVESALG
jgi:hypothetical protein